MVENSNIIKNKKSKITAQKELIICQGGKEELEEITGKKYEFIPLAELKKYLIKGDLLMIRSYGMRWNGRCYAEAKSNMFIRTYLEGICNESNEDIKFSGPDVMVDELVALDHLGGFAHGLKADAIIHYSGFYQDVDRSANPKGKWYVVRGTPLREVK